VKNEPRIRQGIVAWLDKAEASQNGRSPGRAQDEGVRTPTRKYVRYGDGFEELHDLSAVMRLMMYT
jgi:hypothetical protein